MLSLCFLCTWSTFLLEYLLQSKNDNLTILFHIRPSWCVDKITCCWFHIRFRLIDSKTPEKTDKYYRFYHFTFCSIYVSYKKSISDQKYWQCTFSVILVEVIWSFVKILKFCIRFLEQNKNRISVLKIMKWLTTKILPDLIFLVILGPSRLLIQNILVYISIYLYIFYIF